MPNYKARQGADFKINGFYLASSLTPNAKEIENSSREINELVQKILKLQTDETETG